MYQISTFIFKRSIGLLFLLIIVCSTLLLTSLDDLRFESLTFITGILWIAAITILIEFPLTYKTTKIMCVLSFFCGIALYITHFQVAQNFLISENKEMIAVMVLGISLIGLQGLVFGWSAGNIYQASEHRTHSLLIESSLILGIVALQISSQIHSLSSTANKFPLEKIVNVDMIILILVTSGLYFIPRLVSFVCRRGIQKITSYKIS